MAIEDSVNFRRIDDRLTTSGLVSAEQLQHLGAEGYDAVVNLLPDSHDQAVVDEAGLVRDQGLDYVHIPVDFASPTHAELEAFTEALDTWPEQKVHVHSAANWRVSAFYALYAERKGWWTAEEGNALIAGLWDPAEHPAWDAFIQGERGRAGP